MVIKMSEDSSNRLLDELASKQALHELSIVYCRGADRCDAHLFGSVWTDDAQVDCAGFVGPAAEFVRMVTTPSDARERSFHTVTNPYFRIDGDAARGEVHVTAVSTVNLGGQKLNQLVGGRYIDEYKRIGGVWKISRRTFVFDWDMNFPVSGLIEEQNLLGQITKRGRPGQDDPFYALFVRP